MTKLHLDDTNIHIFLNEVSALARIWITRAYKLSKKENQKEFIDEINIEDNVHCFMNQLEDHIKSGPVMKPVSLEASGQSRAFSPHISH